MKNRIFVLLICALPSLIFAEYPLIREIVAFRDELYNQQQIETESWYYNDARGLSMPPLSLYRYESSRNDSLIALSAAFSLPVDTLASINGIENLSDFSAGQELVVPTAPGLYLNIRSESSWMRLLRKQLVGQKAHRLVIWRGDTKVETDYYPGLHFPGNVKSRFILPLFVSPLNSRVITSPYGFRNHPVTGSWEMHVGTDYRAPVGTDVFSCADGTVFSQGELEDYGKFVIIKHRNGYSSVYGHLSEILVKSGQFILEGELIGKSGNTGLSTGPHLHFEIRRDGGTLDPENLLIKGAR